MQGRGEDNYITKNVSSIASVAPTMRSSSHVWSQACRAKRASIYKVFAGVEFLNDGWKLVMRESNIWGSNGGENTSIFE